MKIASVELGRKHPPFIIAELSGNHQGSLERALMMVDSLASTGVHAIKLQTYTPDTMTLDLDTNEFVIRTPGSLWEGKTLYELYAEAQTPWEWHEPIFRRAEQHGLLAFSSPFDEGAVEFLEQLQVPCYKIASSELVDVPLIRHAAATGKPLILSTGMATLDEIDDAVDAARSGGCKSLVLLKCTASYPARADDANLRTIPEMRERYGCEVGVSDHTLGVGVAAAAVALGATVVEKHATLDRGDGAVDSAFSLEPQEFAELVSTADDARTALGEAHYGPTPGEVGARTRRRSLYLVEDVAAGTVLTKHNVRSIRPAAGLPPKFYDDVLGRRVRSSQSRGTPLDWDMLLEK